MQPRGPPDRRRHLLLVVFIFVTVLNGGIIGVVVILGIKLGRRASYESGCSLSISD